MEMAEPGAFSFGLVWGINFTAFFSFFLDEYVQPLSKIMVSGFMAEGLPLWWELSISPGIV